jgi:hypothetical protein
MADPIATSIDNLKQAMLQDCQTVELRQRAVKNTKQLSDILGQMQKLNNQFKNELRNEFRKNSEYLKSIFLCLGGKE